MCRVIASLLLKESCAMFRKRSQTPLITRKFSGIGWTLNPAHPLTWVVVTGLLGLSIYFAFSK